MWSADTGRPVRKVPKQEYETFMQITPCRACKGQRLKPEALAVTVGEKNISQITETVCRESESDL